MTSAERWLKRLLRVIGIMCLPAIVGVLMPHCWLAWAVERVEPGTPVKVLVSYLARVLSAFYVLLGVLLLIFSTDVRRYVWPLRLLALWCLPVPVVFIIHARGAFAAGLTGWFFWAVALDMVCGFAMAVAILLLLSRIARADRRQLPANDA